MRRLRHAAARILVLAFVAAAVAICPCDAPAERSAHGCCPSEAPAIEAAAGSCCSTASAPSVTAQPAPPPAPALFLTATAVEALARPAVVVRPYPTTRILPSPPTVLRI
jgi:hypothetical protein